MFQFRRFPFDMPILFSIRCTRHDPRRVSPFGYSRFTAWWQLAETFRSLPRPSSVVYVKASILCPWVPFYALTELVVESSTRKLTYQLTVNPYIGRKRYSLLFKYLHKQIFERDNKHQSHHLTIETQIVKLLCVPHMPSVAWRIRITSITRLMISRTVVVECTFETSFIYMKSLSAFYSTIYYSKLCLICKHPTALYFARNWTKKSLVVDRRYAPHYTIPTWGVWRASVN